MLPEIPITLLTTRRTKNLLVTSISALILLLLPSAAFAGEGQTNGAAPHGDVNFCVTGSVIDWEENALAPNDGWTAITATLFPSLASVNIPTNADGTFAVSLPTAPGSTHWEFTISLQPGWEGVTETTFTVPVDVAQTACNTIRFKLKEWVKVIVIKIDQEHNLLPGWTISANPGPGYPYGKPQSKVTNANGEVSFHLTPGVWVFSESPPAGVSYTPIAPSSGAQTVNVQPPGPLTIRFKNRVVPKGCIDVHKRDAYGVGLPGWKFQLLRADGTVAQTGVTNAFGHLNFGHLLHGPYEVVETPQYGWTPVTPTHVDVTVGNGGYNNACETVWFENKQYHDYCIEGHKVDKNGSVGLPGWIISADPQTAGGFKPANVTTDGTGYFRFDLPDNDYRIPGETYKICEAVKEGWVTVGEACYSVTLPEKPGYCVEVPRFINMQKQYDTVEEEDGMGYGAGNHDTGNHDTGHNGDSGHPTDGCTKHHTVKHGEALYSIGSQHGKTAQQMLNANPWVRNQPHFYVYVGQKLCIP